MDKIITEIYRQASYRDMLRLQCDYFNPMVEQARERLPVSEERLLLVEHLPVYTLGRHGHRSNMLMPERLLRDNIELVEIDRGGDITYHGPGQLVAYPIIDLQNHGLGVKAYVEMLEQAVIDTINEYGITGERLDGATGVWIEANTSRARKICAIGVKCKRFITMHGLALNVTTDLSNFNVINPCGFVDLGVTSMAAEIGREPDWLEVALRLKYNLLRLLGF